MTDDVYCVHVCLPAVDNNGGIATPPLCVHDAVDDGHNDVGIVCLSIRSPGQHLELGHSVRLPRLRGGRETPFSCAVLVSNPSFPSSYSSLTVQKSTLLHTIEKSWE